MHELKLYECECTCHRRWKKTSCDYVLARYPVQFEVRYDGEKWKVLTCLSSASQRLVRPGTVYQWSSRMRLHLISKDLRRICSNNFRYPNIAHGKTNVHVPFPSSPGSRNTHEIPDRFPWCQHMNEESWKHRHHWAQLYMNALSSEFLTHCNALLVHQRPVEAVIQSNSDIGSY